MIAANAEFSLGIRSSLAKAFCNKRLASKTSGVVTTKAPIISSAVLEYLPKYWAGVLVWRIKANRDTKCNQNHSWIKMRPAAFLDDDDNDILLCPK